MFMGWWMVPTRIPNAANSNNIETACNNAGLKTLCDHAAWNNGKCLALGSFHMSYNGHHPTFVPPYLTNKEFYAGQAHNGYAIQNTGGSHRWETNSVQNGQTICVTRDSPIKFKIADLKSELRIVKSQAAQIGDLRKEVYNLQQQLLTERLQVKALSEELENPLNYHRWRKLEGTDPDTWEMLQKIQTLQKRLIKKTEEVVEKDVVIQEKEKLYIELKNLLARQPGPEVAEQLSIYQQNLKEKTR
jgi:hypothetical protein